MTKSDALLVKLPAISWPLLRRSLPYPSLLLLRPHSSFVGVDNHHTSLFSIAQLLVRAMAHPELTTTFTPPHGCLATTDIFIVWNSNTPGQCQVLGQTPDGSKTCLPPGYTPGASYFFSPGLCPSGYVTACSTVNSIGSLTETAVTCCPRCAPASCEVANLLLKPHS
jgi:hypothetical protein